MCNKCQQNDCGCSQTTVEYKKCNECAPQADCTCPVKDLSTDCIVYTGDDLNCSGIEKNTILTDLIQELDEYVCTAVSQLSNNLSLVNVGDGAQVYKGVDNIGRKQLRTILGSDTVTVTQDSDTISLEVDLSGLEQPPLQSIDQGNGTGIIIRGRNQDNYLAVGNGALDLSYSGNAFPISGASGTHAFTANSKTIASAEDSAAFNSANVSEQGSFAINESQNSGFYAFSWGSGNAKGTNSMAGGVFCETEQQGSTATGTSTKAFGFSSDAIGQETQALGDLSSAAGFRTKTTGNSSYAGGNSNEANSHAEFSIGAFGTLQSGNPLAEVFVPTDRLFNIGNGNITPLTAIITRSDALTLLKNGLLTLPSVTNSLITAASGKAVVTKEYLVSQIPSIVSGVTTTVAGNGTTIPYTVETVNLQKAISANYTLQAGDNNYSIKVNNGSTPITITVPIGLPSNFFVGITQKGTADVTLAAASGVTLSNPVGLKIKGQGYCVGVEQIGNTNSFDVLADTKS